VTGSTREKAPLQPAARHGALAPSLPCFLFIRSPKLRYFMRARRKNSKDGTLSKQYSPGNDNSVPAVTLSKMLDPPSSWPCSFRIYSSFPLKRDTFLHSIHIFERWRACEPILNLRRKCLCLLRAAVLGPNTMFLDMHHRILSHTIHSVAAHQEKRGADGLRKSENLPPLPHAASPRTPPPSSPCSPRSTSPPRPRPIRTPSAPCPARPNPPTPPTTPPRSKPCSSSPPTSSPSCMAPQSSSWPGGSRSSVRRRTRTSGGRPFCRV
jgi:hypothetical protein